MDRKRQWNTNRKPCMAALSTRDSLLVLNALMSVQIDIPHDRQSRKRLRLSIDASKTSNLYWKLLGKLSNCDVTSVQDASSGQNRRTTIFDCWKTHVTCERHAVNWKRVLNSEQLYESVDALSTGDVIRTVMSMNSSYVNAGKKANNSEVIANNGKVQTDYEYDTGPTSILRVSVERLRLVPVRSLGDRLTRINKPDTSSCLAAATCSASYSLTSNQEINIIRSSC